VSTEITGGVPLAGDVRIRGAKNFVTKAMVAGLLTDEVVEVTNAPMLSDVATTLDLVSSVGASALLDEHAVSVSGRGVHADGFEELMRVSTNRIGVLVAGPVLARTGTALIPALGGCKIGERPVGFHRDVLVALGAHAEVSERGIELSAPGGLKGARVDLPYPSVGATEQGLLAGALASGVTTITNAALEPEVKALGELLTSMGAEVNWSGRSVSVRGARVLSGARVEAMPDRLEVGSWALAALATDGEVRTLGARRAELRAFTRVFERVGGVVRFSEEGATWSRGPELRAVEVASGVHPGFATDHLQPLGAALASVAALDQPSVLHETVYENRVGYAATLELMGARVQVSDDCGPYERCRFSGRAGHTLRIASPGKLRAAEFSVPDLRGGFSQVIAALAAEGTSVIHGAEVLERGYEDFAGKIRGLGGKVRTAQDAVLL
jgi:UDP-N-acetylglucosamine 1-carboxyvinyltransferase